MVDPVAFSLGSVDIYWYGFFVALAVALGLPWTLARAARVGLNARQAERVLWVAIAGGVVGARIGYVVQNLAYFGAHPAEIGALSTGGLSIHGALFGGFLAGVLAARWYRLEFWRLADASVPAILLGMILGRFGNFTNAELFGPPTDVPWKLFIPVASRPEGMSEIAFYHPTFLYDSMLNTLLLLILLRIDRKAALSSARPVEALMSEGGSKGSSVQPGRLTLWFVAGIALTRFLVEFWRLGEVTALGMTPAQLVSLALLAGAGWLLLRPASPSQV